MKTIIQTKNEGSKTSFTKKISSLVFLLLVLICFSNQSKAQAMYKVTVINNNSTCTFDIRGFDGSSIAVWPNLKVSPSSTLSTSCQNYSDGIMTIRVTCDTRCTTAVFTITGGWAETIAQLCNAPCGGGASFICTTTTATLPSPCGGTTTEEITITIN